VEAVLQVAVLQVAEEAVLLQVAHVEEEDKRKDKIIFNSEKPTSLKSTKLCGFFIQKRQL
jgi:hypothetical protein